MTSMNMIQAINSAHDIVDALLPDGLSLFEFDAELGVSRIEEVGQEMEFVIAEADG